MICIIWHYQFQLWTQYILHVRVTLEMLPGNVKWIWIGTLYNNVHLICATSFKVILLSHMLNFSFCKAKRNGNVTCVTGESYLFMVAFSSSPSKCRRFLRVGKGFGCFMWKPPYGIFNWKMHCLLVDNTCTYTDWYDVVRATCCIMSHKKFKYCCKPWWSPWFV